MQVLGQQAVLDKAVLYSLVNRMKVRLGGCSMCWLAGCCLVRHGMQQNLHRPRCWGAFLTAWFRLVQNRVPEQLETGLFSPMQSSVVGDGTGRDGTARHSDAC
jgi:hypothetical protein